MTNEEMDLIVKQAAKKAIAEVLTVMPDLYSEWVAEIALNFNR